MASAPVPGPQNERQSAAVQQAVRSFAERFYLDSDAPRFGLRLEDLERTLAAIVQRSPIALESAEIHDFLNTLRLDELILARCCAAGNEDAWTAFVERYRQPMYATAYKITGDNANALLLANSLWAELVGVDDRGRQRNCKLLSYEGRGSLEGWLRTVLLQMHIDGKRRTRHEVSLDEQVESGLQPESPRPEPVRCDPRVERATSGALAELAASSRFMLAAYYLDQRTLAEIATLMKVHESTISRKLERLRARLEKDIRARLIVEGMSPRAAEEAISDTDVRDLNVAVKQILQQEEPESSF